MKNLTRLFSLTATLISLAACSPVKILNVITPSGNFDRAVDIDYGDDARQSLDVYTPKIPRDNAPVIVFVHGGGWDSGDKSLYKFIGETFTGEGYTVVVPNYRLYPSITFPDPVVDTAKATAWAAGRYQDRAIILMGHSAGAYNVLMTGMVPEYLKAEDVNVCERIAGIVSLSAPTGIIPLTEEPLITVFPDRFTGTDAPLGNTGNKTPPLFLVNGGKDKTVYPQNSEKLGEDINARGGKAEVKIYPKMNHTDPVKVLSRYFDGNSVLKADILDFMRRVPKKGNYCH